MYRIALCDDNKAFLELLKQRVERYCMDHDIKIELSVFDDSDLLVNMTDRGYIFDAYILDIEMQDYSGIELAKMIREKSEMAYVLFLTAFSQYAVYACGRGIFRYILKDTVDIELSRVLRSLFEALDHQDKNLYYFIQNQRRCLKIPHRDIVYIYRVQKNVRFELKNGECVNERSTLEVVFNKLSINKDFYVLDRGIILNLMHVQGISNGKIKLDNGVEITSSIKHIEELKHQIHMYWRRFI